MFLYVPPKMACDLGEHTIWETLFFGHLTGTVQDVNKLQKTKMQQCKMGVLLYSHSSRQ